MPTDAPTTPDVCPACGAATEPGDQFCESCGADLSAGTSTAVAAAPTAASSREEARTHLILPQRSKCAACGGALDPDRWCTQCGLRAPSERDHWSEQPAPWVGAVCDRGIRHTRNEDAMATAALGEPGSFAALVVCDGVTTAADSDLASLAAARAARDLLVNPVTDEGATASSAGRIVHWTAQLEAASTAANRAATDVGSHVAAGLEPPSCTFVAAVVERALLTVGWVGDSRAYWLPDTGPAAQLTVDDSWATDQVAAGMDRDAAEADHRAHSITRWLGADSHDAVARCASISLGGAGWVLVCSDGLWNYCSPADELRDLVAAAAAERGDDPLVVAQALVDFANGRGGHDNVTVALARITAASD